MSTPRADVLGSAVSRTLVVAAITGAVLVAAGIVAWLVTGTPMPPDRADPLRWIDQGAIGVIGFGLLVVMLTPVAQLAAAIAVLTRLGEHRDAAVAGVVLLILVASAVAGVVLEV